MIKKFSSQENALNALTVAKQIGYLAYITNESLPSNPGHAWKVVVIRLEESNE